LDYFEAILAEMRRRGLHDPVEAQLARELKAALDKEVQPGGYHG
jgi:hypothetical protein